MITGLVNQATLPLSPKSTPCARLIWSINIPGSDVPELKLYLNLSYCDVIWGLANQPRTNSWNLFQTGLVLPSQNCRLFCMQLFSSSSSHFDSTKELNPLKHGSSDGRVRDLRSKGQGFEPGLDPMRPASKCKHYYCLGRVMIQGCPLVVDTNWSSKKPGMKKYKNVA